MDMEQEMEAHIQSSGFGKGRTGPGPYNTSWVARLPNPNQTDQPIFGEALNWIRNHQLEDGSWGTEYPFFICDRVIATLSCVICLLQWYNNKDENKIERAIIFLKNRMNELEQLENIKNKMPTGFELIFPIMIDELKEFGYDLGFKNVVHIYRQMRHKKLEILEKMQNDLKVPWQYNLEVLGDLVTNEQMKRYISKERHLICLSYSATAFALIKGVVHQKSIDMFRELINANNGGIPTMAEMPVFETAWSIAYIYWAGYPIDSESMVPHIQWLKELWTKFGRIVSADDDPNREGLPSDVDCSASTIFVLKISNQIQGFESIKPLMNFYREDDDYFVVYPGEKQLSLSANINCLIALSRFQEIPRIKGICECLSNWIKSVIRNVNNNYKTDDKWHFSSLYSLSRALFCFEFIDPKESDSIYVFLISNQNADGGWGESGKSTPIETGLIVISICYWLKNYRKGRDLSALAALKEAKHYLNVNDVINYLWIEKILYSMVYLDKTIILAAKYCLAKLNL